MSKAKEILSNISEAGSYKALEKSVSEYLKQLDELDEVRGEVELELDDAGLLEGKLGKLYYRADEHVDKAQQDLRNLLTAVKRK